MKIDISFVISVYNQPVHILKRCINSLKNINDSINYEIIIIDDGSKSENLKEYKNIIKNNSLNIKFFHKKNGGVSSARNYGINHSNGKYISFIDADDEEIASNIDLMTLDKDINLIIYSVKMKNLVTNRFQFFSLYKKTKKVYTFDLSTFLIRDGLLNWVFGKLYRRSFLLKNKLYFDENMKSGEDYIFNLNVLNCTLDVTYINVPVYIYNYDPNSDFNRKKNFPRVCLENAITLYKERLAILSKIKKDNEKLKSSLTNELVDSIFYCFAGSIITEKETILKKCLSTINIYVNNYQLSFSSKLKIIMIKCNNKQIVKAYLKAKKAYRYIIPYKF